MEMGHLETPSFIIDEGIFEENIKEFKKALNDYFLNSKVGYSFKTNSLPYIIKKAEQLGCYAEVVSDTEYALAIYAGYNPEKIIFNGPKKGRETFEKAFKAGSIINIDSIRKIEWLERLSGKGINGKIGIRANIDLESILPGQTSTGDAGGRFGFCVENGCFHEVIERLKALNGIQISGIHMHVSNKSKASEVYEVLADRACEIAQEEELVWDYIDIGGGFFGGDDGGDAYRKYVEAIYKALKNRKMEDVCLIVEPGASVVTTAVDYITNVIDVKETVRGRFVVTDGSRIHIDPFFHKNKYVYSIKSVGEKIENEQVVCGYTCMENDRFMKIYGEQELIREDKIIYHIVGGYTMCFNPLFIEYLPRVYVKKIISMK